MSRSIPTRRLPIVEIRSTSPGVTSVTVDGRDISNQITALTLNIEPASFPVLDLQVAPDEILYSGPTVVKGVPLNGIERLRRRFGR